MKKAIIYSILFSAVLFCAVIYAQVRERYIWPEEDRRTFIYEHKFDSDDFTWLADNTVAIPAHDPNKIWFTDPNGNHTTDPNFTYDDPNNILEIDFLEVKDGILFSWLTASRLLATDASKNLVSTDLSSWVTGTTNRVTVANDGDGTITLSAPQDIHTGASPTFAGLTIINAINEFSIDGTLVGNSDSAVPTEKAVKTYVDAAGGGESTTVSDTTTINLTLTVADITADGLYTAGDHLTLTGADFDVDDDFLSNNGDMGTGVYDFGGSTTFEIPNTAGDVTLAVAGQVAVDTTQKQLVVYDGVENAVPLIHSMQLHADLAGMWDIDHEWQLLDMDRGATTFPDGIVITSWYVDCSVADPATELNANLYYCDALADGAFPGANPVLVDVLDTTTGNASCTDMSTSDLGSGIIPTAKILYVLIDADPTDANTVWSIIVNYYIPES